MGAGMRFTLSLFSLLCLASTAAAAQPPAFDTGLTPNDRATVTEALKYESSFKSGTMSIAKAQLNTDGLTDFIILSAKPDQCARAGCAARILLSHLGPSGSGSYQHARLNDVKTISVGALRNGVRILIVNGENRIWNGKSFG